MSRPVTPFPWRKVAKLVFRFFVHRSCSTLRSSCCLPYPSANSPAAAP